MARSSWIFATKVKFYEANGSRLNFCDVISGESSEDSGSLWRSDEPAVVALLHDEDDVALLQLDLVVVLGVVVVESAVPAQVKKKWKNSEMMVLLETLKVWCVIKKNITITNTDFVFVFLKYIGARQPQQEKHHQQQRQQQQQQFIYNLRNGVRFGFD